MKVKDENKKYERGQKTLLNSPREGNVVLSSVLFELQPSLALSHWVEVLNFCALKSNILQEKEMQRGKTAV